jgi:hypothetical protein
VIVVILLFVITVLAVAVTVVRVNRLKFTQANQVVPGVATRAPASWAGAHTPEARLHRRLRDAVASLRANASIGGVGLLEARVALEQQALAVDERLVVVASLPERTRPGQLAPVAEAVDAVEAAVASLLTAGPALDPARSADVERALADVRERVALLAEARTELDPGQPS